MFQSMAEHALTSSEELIFGVDEYKHGLPGIALWEALDGTEEDWIHHLAGGTQQNMSSIRG